jgi:lipopolysaccharide/colanic/teichoic acid biosynthesis glycosyltransferase
MFKFRGMVDNALSFGPELTQKNDPRITRVGRILRRTSIDEIPQVVNVLKGEMSLVGPRPCNIYQGLYCFLKNIQSDFK